MAKLHITYQCGHSEHVDSYASAFEQSKLQATLAKTVCKACSFRTSRGKAKGHSIICTDCGVYATVPFSPKSNRPAYCSPCFGKRKAGK